jgi:toxin secretion/phage lysis holin
MKQTIVNASVGVGGSLVSYFFGGWSDLLSFFLLTIVIDYVTGLSASLKEGKGLSSHTGFWGLAKKALMLVVVVMAHRMDELMGLSVIETGAIYFYLANELISITENYGRLGLPLPDQVKKMIQILKNKGGS